MSVDDSRLHRVLGARVRQLRERAGDSQGDLAGALGLSRTSVVNVEAGRQRPPLATVYRIARRYGVEVSALLPPLAEVDDGAVIGRLLDEAVGTEGRSREALETLVREVSADYDSKR